MKHLIHALIDYLFNKPICAFAEWYDTELARERAREPKRRAQRAQRLQRKVVGI